MKNTYDIYNLINAKMVANGNRPNDRVNSMYACGIIAHLYEQDFMNVNDEARREIRRVVEGYLPELLGRV